MPRMKAPPIVDFHNIGKGFALSDLPIMQNPEIHWDGEPVAVVVAETLERAEYAASLVSVEYDVEIPDVSFEGMKPKAVVPDDIMGEPSELEIGNVEKGMLEAAARVDHVYHAPRFRRNVSVSSESVAFLGLSETACSSTIPPSPSISPP